MAEENNGKAKQDLDQAKEAVDKVARAEAQIRELLGEMPASIQETQGVQEAQEGQETQEVQDGHVAQDTSFSGVPTSAQDTTSFTADESGVVQTVQSGSPAPQDSYWRGFQPVVPPSAQVQPTAQPTVPLSQGQPVQQPYYQQPTQQPLYPAAQQPIYPQPGVQPAQPMQPGQPAQLGQPAQPAQPVQQPQQVYQQPVYPVQPGQPMQQAYPAQPVQPGQPATPQISLAQVQQPVQQSASPEYRSQTSGSAQQPMQGQPVQGGVQPAQAYTPQIQQPSPYVSAQDFTVQPQPNTPAYTKSNKSTLAIVLVIVGALLAIIAALVIGRILATQASDYQSPMIESFNELEDELSEELNNEFGAPGDGYSDHNWGGNGGGNNGNGGGNGGGQDDNVWSFDWDGDENFIVDPNSLGHGSTHISGGGIDADDGELHDAWNKDVSYSYTEHEFDKEGIETIDFYNKVIAYDFDVEYPQLTGDIPNLEAINNTIKDTAMKTVEDTYINPTSDARKLLEVYAENSYGVPANVGAILESDVDYAISFNNENFISISFSDEYSIGSWYGGFVSLRTVNINLQTGEIYELKDVLNLNDDIAKSFWENHRKYDQGAAESIAGEETLIGAIQGKGTGADNVDTTFFVDGNGKINLGATYEFENETSWARGWWDYTLTESQLEGAKKNSTLWDVLN